MDVRRFAEEHGSTLLTGLRQQALRLRRGLRPGVDAVHDARVAVRRLDACLDAFEPLFRRKPANRLRDKSRRLRKCAGEVRNLDIALDLCREARLPRALVADLRRRRALAAENLHSAATAIRLPSAAPPLRASIAEAPARDFAERLVVKRLKRFFERGRDAIGRTAGPELHRFRVEAKRLRYALELFAPLFDQRRLRPVFRTLRRIQHLLGEISDCESVRELLREVQPKQTLEFLDQREHHRLTQFRRYWRRSVDGEEQNWLDAATAPHAAASHNR